MSGERWCVVLTEDITETMRSRFRAGDSSREIAGDYGCPLRLVEILVDDINAVD